MGDSSGVATATPNDEESPVSTSHIDDVTLARRLVFGGNVRRHRQEQELSQEQLAGEAGIDRKTINRIEQGVHSVRLDNVWLIADALGVDVRDLFVDRG